MIRSLTKKDCDVVSQLHIQSLPTNFSGKAGQELLLLYYASILSEQGAIGFVAENIHDQIEGFVCGVWDASLLRRYMVTHHGLRLLGWGCLQIIQKPGIFFSLPNRLKNRSTHVDKETGYELRPIVVAQTARGTGVAQQLVQVLLDDAHNRGFSEVHLFTEHDNIAARKFYTKVGFMEKGYIDRDGYSFVRYLYSL